MKELSNAEKAIAYDQIIKKANKMHHENCETCQMCIEELIPELAESEDEKIRKEIIRFIQMEVEDEIVGNKWLAWLEKQGKHKPIDKVEPNFHEGEWITDGYDVLQISNVDIENQYYNCVNGNDGDINLTDKAYHLWTIQDAKDGDVLYFSDETIVIFKDLYNATTFHSYCHIEDGEFGISCEELPDWWEGKGFHPATKEQRDLLFQKMKEAGYEWDAEKKELEKQGEQEKDILEDDILDGYILDGNEDGLIAETIRYKHENQGRQNHTQEIEPFEAEHGKYYYCIKDYFCGGRKQASKGDVIQALRGLPIMGLKDASEYFLPVNFIKCNSAWGEEDEHRIKDTVYFLDTAKKHYASTEELDACIDWIQSLKDRVQLKQEWNEEDEIDKEILNAAILFAMNSTDEFACNGVSKEDVIDWLKSFKDRVQSQQKQEWSEEDSYYRSHIIQIIEEIKNAPLKRREDWDAYINWLKSLRPQNR